MWIHKKTAKCWLLHKQTNYMEEYLKYLWIHKKTAKCWLLHKQTNYMEEYLKYLWIHKKTAKCWLLHKQTNKLYGGIPQIIAEIFSAMLHFHSTTTTKRNCIRLCKLPQTHPPTHTHTQFPKTPKAYSNIHTHLRKEMAYSGNHALYLTVGIGVG